MIWHPRRTVSYLRMQGQGWGWELFLAVLLVTWLSLVLSPLPIVEWSMSKDFSPLAGEIILDNLQTLRCTITGLTTVRLLLIDVPSPASHTGILVADAYSSRDSRHQVLWQQLPFVKCDMSGIHNLSLTKRLSRQHEALCRLPCSKRSERDWPHASLGSRCLLDHSLICRGSKALRDPILTPSLMVKITASSSPHPYRLIEISRQWESHSFRREILFPWLKGEKKKPA